MDMKKKIKFGIAFLAICALLVSFAVLYLNSIDDRIMHPGEGPLPLAECCIDYFILEGDALGIHEFQLNAPDPSCRNVFMTKFGKINHNMIIQECCSLDKPHHLSNTPKAVSEQKKFRIQFREDTSGECFSGGSEIKWYVLPVNYNLPEDTTFYWSIRRISGDICIFKLCKTENDRTYIFSKEFETAERFLVVPDNWKTYSNPKANFTFRYPENWEITSEYFYETLSGIKSERFTVILGKDEKEISINLRQAQCSFPCRCKGVGSNLIQTCSENTEVIEIYYKILSTFRIVE